MPRNLILTRNCSGIRTRIECAIRPLAGERGLWMLLCAAGMSDAQPSTVKAQGPFHGPCVAEGLLEAIAKTEALTGNTLTYTLSDQNRAGDHIWYVSDIRRFRADYPDWEYKFDMDTILKEMVEATIERNR